MDDLKGRYFDFNVKPDFKELESNDKLVDYTQVFQSEIGYYERVIKYKKLPDISKLNNDKDLKEQYILLSEYISKMELFNKQKEYLKVLEQREIELNEYLKEVVKKQRDNLKL